MDRTCSSAGFLIIDLRLVSPLLIKLGLCYVAGHLTIESANFGIPRAQMSCIEVCAKSRCCLANNRAAFCAMKRPLQSARAQFDLWRAFLQLCLIYVPRSTCAIFNLDCDIETWMTRSELENGEPYLLPVVSF